MFILDQNPSHSTYKCVKLRAGVGEQTKMKTAVKAMASTNMSQNSTCHCPAPHVPHGKGMQRELLGTALHPQGRISAVMSGPAFERAHTDAAAHSWKQSVHCGQHSAAPTHDKSCHEGRIHTQRITPFNTYVGWKTTTIYIDSCLCFEQSRFTTCLSIPRAFSQQLQSS